MKNIKKIFSITAVFLSLILLTISGCKDSIIDAPVQPPLNTGSANFTRMVSIGNSLTAGLQSNALSARDQVWSFGSMIAKQVQTASYEQPLIQDPGIGGRLKLVNLAPTIVAESQVPPVASSNLNINLAKPYNNLGIPGAIVYDMTDETDFTAKSTARKNPYFSLVLRNQAFGKSVVAQVKTLKPTFITVWIGANDVLGYATSGGTKGTDATGKKPTDVPVFNLFYKKMLDSLAVTGAKVVVANIPNVTAIPFFTTVGPVVGAVLKAAGGLKLYYQKSGITSSSLENTTLSSPTGPFITLVGQTFAPSIGKPTGFWYKANNYPGIPAGIDTTKPFGVHPQNPWPDALILDNDEITIAKNAVTSFNGIIASEAGAKGYGLVDISSFFDNLVATGGLSVTGVGIFTPSFITGGTFSYDGVHPTSRGYAIIANEWIKVINSKFSANIPLVDISSIPGQPIGMGKLAAGQDKVTSIYEPHTFDNMIRYIVGSLPW